MAKTYEIVVQREINELYQDILKAIKKGKAVKAEVKSLSTKTKEQLGFYWAIILPRIQQGMQEQGCEMSLVEINQFLNDKFFCNVKVVTWRKGNDEYVHTIRIPRSKSGASEDEMSEFLDKVIRWAATDMSVDIPQPLEKAPF